MDCGFYSSETEGLFSIFTRERVSAYVGRRSSNRRPETDGRERERGAGGRHSDSHGGAAMASGKDTPERAVQGLGATVRKSGGTGRKLGRRGTRLGHHDGRRRKPRRRAPWSAAKARGRSRIGPQTATKYQIESTEGRRGVRRSSPRLQTETNATRGRRFARR